MHNLRLLLYTIAFDSPDLPPIHRTMAKMLTGGLLRNFFGGKIVVFRNTPAPLFKVERKGLEEIYVDVEPGGTVAQQFKYRARHWLETDGCDAVAFVDVDCAVLRGVDHLFPDESWDILWQPERGHRVNTVFHNAYLTDEEMKRLTSRDGANSGTWAVRTEHYHAVMKEWERLDAMKAQRRKMASDQPAWDRLLLDTPLRTRPFERDEIMLPPLGGNYCEWRDAAILHVPGWPLDAKVEFLAGLFYARYLGDPGGHYLDLIEP